MSISKRKTAGTSRRHRKSGGDAEETALRNGFRGAMTALKKLISSPDPMTKLLAIGQVVELQQSIKFANQLARLEKKFDSLEAAVRCRESRKKS